MLPCDSLMQIWQERIHIHIITKDNIRHDQIISIVVFVDISTDSGTDNKRYDNVRQGRAGGCVFWAEAKSRPFR